MRLWTLHPRYLDRQGLLALWREGLLARQVLRGKTRGYRHHPQLLRFRQQRSPAQAIAAYLRGVHAESRARGYRFDASKLGRGGRNVTLVETRGQLLHEWAHLRRKLRARAPRLYRATRALAVPQAHPLFRIVPGAVRDWERSPARAPRRPGTSEE